MTHFKLKIDQMHIIYRIILLLVISLISACSDSSLNNPYPASEDDRNIYYDTFSERPKHLDPARSYSSNEYVFLGQIYESPLQYHFLKRPYELIPLTASEMPVAIYQDSEGNIIDEETDSENISRVIYRIKIRSGVMYQPHPALATGKMDEYVYHKLAEQDLKGIHTLNDFKETGTRELTAADYVYQIKRMAHPKIHSPIAGLMSQYILGLSELSKQLEEESKTSEKESSAYIDLREYELEGTRVIDKTMYFIHRQACLIEILPWTGIP
jgi:oligopeptide transport system substrate-binding protein